ncbi:tRNA1(Val) (adenine(37)-N6)-methyltransferase [Salisediminibacterium beveridgei]|uniref:Putative O-methyltransferase n=1 Tax=Salisediminibacterium beveridgei TaxID=632773 RepID=A0A1D7R045_9BACI|nr:tRNA1(Val) (adenine(37)-N6)-methyltransferase [Salisediminibacterium beveridgei]AOM84636.1 putative O-methyltransferase [Salisediminibacterium beveridgei]
MKERVDRLPGGRQFIMQREDLFSYSMDAVLLGKFATVTNKTRRIIDLCSGTGAVPLVLAERTDVHMEALEIQKELVAMSRRSMALNQLDDRVKIMHGNVMNAGDYAPWNQFDLVTCNPPYFPVMNGADLDCENPFDIARHELHCTLEGISETAKKLLKSKGRFAMVHRPERVPEIFEILTRQRFSPKRIRYVHPSIQKEANMVLIEAVRDGQPGLTTMPPLIVYDEGQQYTKEFTKHYEYR